MSKKDDVEKLFSGDPSEKDLKEIEVYRAKLEKEYKAKFEAQVAKEVEKLSKKKAKSETPKKAEYNYKGLLGEALLNARIANNDRIEKVKYFKHFSKVRGAYTKVMFNLVPYTFSEGETTTMLAEHVPLFNAWIEEKFRAEGISITADVADLAVKDGLALQ